MMTNLSRELRKLLVNQSITFSDVVSFFLKGKIQDDLKLLFYIQRKNIYVEQMIVISLSNCPEELKIKYSFCLLYICLSRQDTTSIYQSLKAGSEIFKNVSGALILYLSHLLTICIHLNKHMTPHGGTFKKRNVFHHCYQQTIKFELINTILYL